MALRTVPFFHDRIWLLTMIVLCDEGIPKVFEIIIKPASYYNLLKTTLTTAMTRKSSHYTVQYLWHYLFYLLREQQIFGSKTEPSHPTYQ